MVGHRHHGSDREVGLSQLRAGDVAEVVSVRGQRAAAGLAAAGLTPGVAVTVLGSGAGGGPVRVILRGARVALRPAVARRVIVRPTGRRAEFSDPVGRPAVAAAIAIACGLATTTPCRGARPLSTDDPGTTPRGHWSLETWVDWSREHEDTATSASLALCYGLGEHSDICAEIQHLRSRSEIGEVTQGLGDLLVTGKWRFLEETETRPALGMTATANVPWGPESEVRSEHVGWGASLLCARGCGGMSLYAALGYTRTGDWERLATWALACEAPLDERWGLACEVTGERSADASSTAMLVGATYSDHNGLTLDIGRRQSLGDPQEVTWTAGVTSEW